MTPPVLQTLQMMGSLVASEHQEPEVKEKAKKIINQLLEVVEADVKQLKIQYSGLIV